jgi:hypothetical protein
MEVLNPPHSWKIYKDMIKKKEIEEKESNKNK